MTERSALRGSRTGILGRIKMSMARHRLGELLVLNGVLTASELRQALVVQKQHGGHLGQVLVDGSFVSRSDLNRILMQQWGVRFLALFVGLFLTLATFSAKQVRAGAIRDVPAQISLVSAANPAFAPVRAYPALFGAEERRSNNLEAFTKWTSMFQRFEAGLNTTAGRRVVQSWQNEIRGYQGLPLEEMARRVNDFVNQQNYVSDMRNWGISDHWSTPIEFFQRGGDCEDFAIAKYASLRALGVPEERLRIAIVQDLQQDIPHAVLIVYTDSGALMLDNQKRQVRPVESVDRYRPIFSINRHAWWLHTVPEATRLASAR